MNKSSFSKLNGKRVNPFGAELVGCSLLDLIGLYLIYERHQNITVKYAVKDLMQHRQRKMPPRVLFDCNKTHRNDGDISEACLFERFAQKRYVIGGTASSACLKQHKCNLVRIVFSAFQRVQKLSDNQNGGIAGVIVDIFQTRFGDFASSAFEHFHFVAVVRENFHDQAEMHRKHIGNQYGIIPLHFFGEADIGIIICVRHAFSSFPTLPKDCGNES